MSVSPMLYYDIMKIIYNYLNVKDKTNLIKALPIFQEWFAIDLIDEITTMCHFNPHTELIGSVYLIHADALDDQYHMDCSICGILFSDPDIYYRQECPHKDDYDGICELCIKLVPDLYIICPTHGAEHICKKCFDFDGTCSCFM
jgi:hypothetical protein